MNDSKMGATGMTELQVDPANVTVADTMNKTKKKSKPAYL